MPDGSYNVLGLIPQTSDFTLDRGIAHFSDLTFSKFRSGQFVYKNQPLKTELAKVEPAQKPSGFRVSYGDWAIVAWLETDRSVQVDSQELSEDDDIPAPAEVIAGCTQRLSVWSDEDPEFDWTDEFNEFTEQLRKRFGLYIYDNVNGCWWTE